MQKFCIVHEYEGSPGDFWALLHDAAYQRAYFDAVEIDFEVEREEVEGSRLARTVNYRSREPVPALLRGFFPDGFGYREHGLFDHSSHRCEFRIEPSGIERRADIRATLSLVDLAHSRLRRTYQGTAAIHVPLLGRRIESETVRSMTVAQEKAAAVTREWLARRTLASRSEHAAE